MANSYTQCTAEHSVICSKEDFLALLEAYDTHEQNDLFPSFTLDYDENDGEVYFYTADDSSDPDQLNRHFLTKFGEIIGKAGLPHLEVGVAYTCDKFRENSHRGTAFRIYPNGDLKWAKLVWE
jgi:hypothetical protein